MAKGAETFLIIAVVVLFALFVSLMLWSIAPERSHKFKVYSRYFLKIFHKAIKNVKTLYLVYIILWFVGCISCKSVNKVQNNTTEKTEVKKVDSSTTKTIITIDTTKTNTETEITTTTTVIEEPIIITNDSAAYMDELPYSIPIGPRILKAKKVTITTATKKTKAATDNGVSTKVEEKKNAISNDSTVAKTDKTKTVIKKPQPFKTAITITLVVVFLGGIAWLVFWLYKKKKKLTIV